MLGWWCQRKDRFLHTREVHSTRLLHLLRVVEVVLVVLALPLVANDAVAAAEVCSDVTSSTRGARVQTGGQILGRAGFFFLERARARARAQGTYALPSLEKRLSQIAGWSGISSVALQAGRSGCRSRASLCAQRAVRPTPIHIALRPR